MLLSRATRVMRRCQPVRPRGLFPLLNRSMLNSGYRGFAPTYGLSNFEALKLRMLQIERAGCIVSSASMRLAELLGRRPRLERRFALPNGVRRIKRVVLCIRPLEQVKFHKAGHAVEIGFAAEPDLLEGFLGASFYLEAIHSDEQWCSPLLSWRMPVIPHRN